MHKIKQKTFFLVFGLSCFVTIVANSQIMPTNSSYPQAPYLVHMPAAYNSGAKINYVRTYEPWKPISDPDQVPIQTVADVKVTTVFVDGLGRPIQTVKKQFTPLQKDMVSYRVFDDFGRESLRYLPYSSPATDGYFKTNPFLEQKDYYSTASLNNSQYGGELVYYERTAYESSPLNRPDTVMAPGNSWSGSNRGTMTKYQLNSALDAVRVWTIGDAAGSLPSTSSTYPAGKLYKTQVIDENGKRMIEYKDMEGKIILKKVQEQTNPGSDHNGWMCTYYVYDFYNQLRVVIQPNAIPLLANSGWIMTQAWLDGFCFRYEYDQRNRMIVKKVPDAGEVWMVYDNLDRLVMIQDANQRQQGKWLYTLYDAVDRPIATGLLISPDNRVTHQAAAYHSTAYPNLNGYSYEELTRSYFDDYSYAGAKSFETADLNKLTPGSNPYPEVVARTELTYGLLTGSKTKVLGAGSHYLTGTMYYDEKGRTIQLLADNVNGGVDVTTSLYDFSGKLLCSYLKQNNPVSVLTPTIRMLTKILYDQGGRVDKTWKQVNDSGIDRLISEQQYDELGQMKNKNLGKQIDGVTPLETLAYKYNIRGWLKSVNEDYTNSINNTNWFGQKLSYHHGFSTQEYNGNIAGVEWRSGGDGVRRSYGFEYDHANRLKKADFTEHYGTWTNANADFSVSNLTYDLNGNILSMHQKSWKLGGSALIDNLAYLYYPASNKLQWVSDAVNNYNSTFGDFKYDPNTKTSTDYLFDANGNMTTDNNKKIGAITYNHLNLPGLISVTGKGTITYTYDALGIKLRKKTVEGTKTTLTTYIGGFVYQSTCTGAECTAPDTLQFAAHEEGRMRRKDDGSFVMDYFVKDHLGSVRVCKFYLFSSACKLINNTNK